VTADPPGQSNLFPAEDRAGGGGPVAPDLQRLPTGSIRVGTSGFSFRDWIGPFFSPGTPPGGMLDFYQRRFRTVELNATYYRIPSTEAMRRMAERSVPDFNFMVKLPAALTHERRDIASPAAAILDAVAPLGSAGRLAGLLAQFPYSFRRTGAAEQYLADLRRALPGRAVFAEFRHASWDAPDLPELLARVDCGFCAVDEPDLPGLMPRRAFVAGDTAYVRLHGRNRRDWWGGGSRRYDYRYDEAELGEWARIVRELAQEARRTYVFFNNCHAGHAVVNARMFAELLSGG